MADPVLPTLDHGGSLADLVADARVAALLPGYLLHRRWFATKNERIEGARFAYAAPFPTAPHVLLAEVAVETGGRTDRYVLPVDLVRPPSDAKPLARTLALADVRGEGQSGLLTDGFTSEDLPRAVLRGLKAGAEMALPDGGTVRFRGTARAADLDGIDGAPIRWLTAEQSNSSLLAGRLAMVKLIRRVVAGVHPEAEMTRFLTAAAYRNTAPLVGEVVRTGPDGTPHTLAIVQGVIPNDGDAWTWVLDRLGGAAEAPDGLRAVNAFIETLGRRLGELHRVLARPTDDPDFRPEQAGDAAVEGWRESVGRQVETALTALAAGQGGLDPDTRALADAVLARRAAILAAVDRLAEAGRGTPLTRVHGDFHLGQVLVSEGDAFIIDFEGEPVRSLDERRAKGSPLRDVAGLIRSIDYAAAAAARQGEASGHRDPMLDLFRTQAVEVFTASYDDASGARSSGPLLDLMLLEKAAYEINYEVANRPGWLQIPLRGFGALADKLASGKERA